MHAHIKSVFMVSFIYINILSLKLDTEEYLRTDDL